MTEETKATKSPADIVMENIDARINGKMEDYIDEQMDLLVGELYFSETDDGSERNDDITQVRNMIIDKTIEKLMAKKY